jgi:hypothetical protein
MSRGLSKIQRRNRMAHSTRANPGGRVSEGIETYEEGATTPSARTAPLSGAIIRAWSLRVNHD